MFCLFQVYFKPDEVSACIVTCGGLCPGLNTVVRELVCGLYHMYGVTRVFGIEVNLMQISGPEVLLIFLLEVGVWVVFMAVHVFTVCVASIYREATRASTAATP